MVDKEFLMTEYEVPDLEALETYDLGLENIR